MFDSLFTFWNVLLMVLGFGFVVFIHELGHFVAARWAGIRVHAFAIGFGQALLSYRKGWGVQRGSSEPRYLGMLSTVASSSKAGATPQQIEAGRDALKQLDSISPTEYRLNWIPFGGYVKMLGQDDLNPDMPSGESDSYQNKPVWKRMVVISAGVIMNVILAAVLFVVVFTAGMTEPAPIVGTVQKDSPAKAVGLEPGDVVRSAGGRMTSTFTDLFVEVAMTQRDKVVELVVDRPTDDGGWERLQFSPVPTSMSDGLGVQAIGVWPETSLELVERSRRAGVRQQFQRVMEGVGFGEVPLGSRVVEIGSSPVDEREFGAEGFIGIGRYASIRLLNDAIESSGGEPVRVVFEGPEGERVETRLSPSVSLQRNPSVVESGGRDGMVTWPQSHLVGLAPVMRVADWSHHDLRQGLEPGDVFKRLGSVSWPSISEGVREIRTRKGSTIDAVLLRGGKEVALTLQVDIAGRVGFSPANDLSVARLASVPSLVEAVRRDKDAKADGPQEFRPLSPAPAAARLGTLDSIRPGTLVRSVDGLEVTDFASLRAALRTATSAASLTNGGATVALEIETPTPSAEVFIETVQLELRASEVEALHGLKWEVAGIEGVFRPVDVLVRADSVTGAVGMGVGRTKRVLQQTYLTFQRLFEGTVRVNQLQGPVGITHTGSMFAERGFIYLLYFLALISANLAVINFLPLPIVDGGQFLMLCYEGLAKKPVPIVVQNVITLGGLLFIGSLFLFITFNDIVRLLGA